MDLASLIASIAKSSSPFFTYISAIFFTISGYLDSVCPILGFIYSFDDWYILYSVSVTFSSIPD